MMACTNNNFEKLVQDLKSNNVTSETAEAAKKWLDESSGKDCVDKLITDLIPLAFKYETKNRSLVINVFSSWSSLDIRHLSKASAQQFKQTVIQQLVQDIDTIRLAEKPDWCELCIFLFRIWGTTLHNDVEIINAILRIVEYGFRSKSIDQKCQAYSCWKELIRNYSLVPSYIRQPKQTKLLIKPLKIPLSRQACVVEIRFDTFVLLLDSMGNEAASSFVDFLQFVFHIRDVGKLETAVFPTYKNIWSKSAAILFQSLGCDGSIAHICNYTTNIGRLIDVTCFENNYKYLVYACRVCCELTCHWCSKTEVLQIIKPLWTSIFTLSHECKMQAEVLAYTWEHFKSLFEVACSNDYVFDFIIMPALTIIYETPQFNTDLFYSNVVIRSLKSYISHAPLQSAKRNDLISKVVLFDNLSISYIELCSILDESPYCETLELFWCQCNDRLRSGMNFEVDSKFKANIITYLIWPLQNIKYLDTKDAIIKIWESTMCSVYEKYVDIVTQTVDKLKMAQQKHNWIIVNFLVVADVMLRISTKKTTTMECITFALNDCLDNCSSALEQFAIFKHGFFTNYIRFLKYIESSTLNIAPVLDQLDKFIQKLPEFIIKSVPENFVTYMEALNKRIYSEEVISIMIKLRPKPIYSTPTMIISRGKKMAKKFAPLSPKLLRKDVDKGSDNHCDGADDILLQKSKRSTTLSPATSINGYEEHFDHSPKTIKGSFLDKPAKQVTPKQNTEKKFVANSRTKNIMDYADSAFVQIDKEVTFHPNRMSEHQRDATCRRRDDIPALYSELTQSQSLLEKFTSDLSNQNTSASTDTAPDSDIANLHVITKVVETSSPKIEKSKSPRKKLFDNDSDSDSGSSSSGKDNLNKKSPMLPTSTDVQSEDPNNGDDTITLLDSSNIGNDSPERTNEKAAVLKDNDTNIASKTRASAANDSRLTRFRARKCTPIKYFKHSKPRGAVASPKRENKTNTAVSSESNKTKTSQMYSKLNVNVVQSPKRLSKIVDKLNKLDGVEGAINVYDFMDESVSAIEKTEDTRDTSFNDQVLSRNTKSKHELLSTDTMPKDSFIRSLTKKANSTKKRKSLINHVTGDSDSPESPMNMDLPIKDLKPDSDAHKIKQNTPKKRKLVPIKQVTDDSDKIDSSPELYQAKLNNETDVENACVHSICISSPKDSSTSVADKDKLENVTANENDIQSTQKVCDADTPKDSPFKLDTNESVVIQPETELMPVFEDSDDIILETQPKTSSNKVSLKNELNQVRIDIGHDTIRSTPSPIRSELNTSKAVDIQSETKEASSTGGSSDIILETEPETILKQDKLKLELNRLRMDIVGGDIATSVPSKRNRKEKFNLSLKKSRKPRQSRKLLENCEPDSILSVSLKDLARHNIMKYSSDSLSTLESEDDAFERSTTLNPEPDLKALDVGLEEGSNDKPNMYTESSETSNAAIIPDNCHSESDIHDVQLENNAQDAFVDECDHNNFIDNSTTSSNPTDKINNEETPCLILPLAPVLLDDTVLAPVKLDDTELAPVKLDDTVLPENISSESLNEPIAETAPVTAPLINISFIGSISDSENVINDQCAETESINMNEIETETCNNSEPVMKDNMTIVCEKKVAAGFILSCPGKDDENVMNDSMQAEDLKPSCPERNTENFLNETSDAADLKPSIPLPIADSIVNENMVTVNILPSSPVTNTTPSKNKELLIDTVDISPINSAPSALEFSASPDLFESEVAHAIENIIDDKSLQKAPSEENVGEVIITTTTPDSKKNVFKKFIGLSKSSNNPFLASSNTGKLLSSTNIVSSPKTNRIQKMMQKLGDRNSSTTLENAVPNYTKEDLLEFSAALPTPDARPRTPSILKRKAPDFAEEGMSPMAKRKRVNFSDPPLTSSKVYFKSDDENQAVRLFKKSGKKTIKSNVLGNQNDMVFNIKVNIKSNNTSIPDALVKNSITETKTSTENLDSSEGISSTSNNADELADIFPELVDCTDDIILVLNNLTDSIMELKEKGITTIGDVVALKRHEIEELPIVSPQFANLKSVLSDYCSDHQKSNRFEDYSPENVDKIISIDCSDKSFSNVNIINNIILSPKTVVKEPPTGLREISQVMKSHIQQLVDEGYSADVIGEQLNNIFTSCNLPLSINLPYY